MNIGAAWPRRSGEKGLSVKLTVIPVQFDGRFVLLPPLPAEIDDLGERTNGRRSGLMHRVTRHAREEPAYAYGPPVRKGPPREAALSLSVGKG